MDFAKAQEPGKLKGMYSSTVLTIAAIAVILILLIIVIVVVGKKRSEAKKVSFTPKETDQKALTQEEKSGNYKAAGGFNFTAGGGTKPEPEPVVNAGQDLGAAQPAQPTGAELVADAEAKLAEEEAARQEAEAQAAAEEAARKEAEAKAAAEEAARKAAEEAAQKEAEAAELAKKEAEAKAAAEEAARKEAEAKAAAEEAARKEAEEAARQEAARKEAEAKAAAEEAARKEAEAKAAAEEAARKEAEEKARKEAEAKAAAEEAARKEAEAKAAAEEAACKEAEANAVAEIEPAAGRLGKLRGRLSRSQNAIGRGVLGILSAGDLDDDAWEEIEDTLVMADLGTATTFRVVEALREKIATQGVESEAQARALLRETLIEACKPDLDRSIKAMPYDGKPAVILVVGVNGTGKTTTTGKLARVLVSMGHSVVLGAADTFRAAAADQLETWGRRVGAQTVRGAEGADPAAVAFDAVAKGVETGVDVVLVDTAGRLHTSVGLMDQLGKVKRVVEKKAKVDEVLLVLDATVGQNGLMQARTFRDVVDITGVVLTKLDGTAKGGIVFQVQEELGVPVKLVGLGEGADDLAPFEPESFVDALLG